VTHLSDGGVNILDDNTVKLAVFCSEHPTTILLDQNYCWLNQVPVNKVLLALARSPPSPGPVIR